MLGYAAPLKDMLKVGVIQGPGVVGFSLLLSPCPAFCGIESDDRYKGCVEDGLVSYVRRHVIVDRISYWSKRQPLFDRKRSPASSDVTKSAV